MLDLEDRVRAYGRRFWLVLLGYVLLAAGLGLALHLQSQTVGDMKRSIAAACEATAVGEEDELSTIADLASGKAKLDTQECKQLIRQFDLD